MAVTAEVARRQLGEPSKQVQAYAMHLEGRSVETIAEKLHSTPASIRYMIREERKKLAALPPASSNWSEDRIAKAVRLFDACLAEVASALDVPPAELRALWVRGVRPSPPIAAPVQPVAPPPAGNENEADTPPLGTNAPVAPEPGDEDLPPAGMSLGQAFNQDDDREADEAELARLAALEGEEADGTPQLQANGDFISNAKAEAPAAVPVARFPAPVDTGPVAASVKDDPSQLVWLMDDQDRYLHESLDGFTTNPRFAWKQPRSKVKAVLGRMPHFKNLDVVAAGK